MMVSTAAQEAAPQLSDSPFNNPLKVNDRVTPAAREKPLRTVGRLEPVALCMGGEQGVMPIRIRCRDKPLDRQQAVECKEANTPSAKPSLSVVLTGNQNSASYADQSNYC